jgi:hypothetical protein
LWCKVLESFGIYDFSQEFNMENLLIKNLNKKNLQLFLSKPFHLIEILNQHKKDSESNLYCRLVHSSCNKQNGKIVSKKAAFEKKQIKMLRSEKLYNRFLKFGNAVHNHIQSNYRLQQNQRTIIFKKNEL